MRPPQQWAPGPPKQWWSPGTSDRALYAHWMHPRVGHPDLGDVGERVKSVRLLHDGSEAKAARTWWGDEGDAVTLPG